LPGGGKKKKKKKRGTNRVEGTTGNTVALHREGKKDLTSAKGRGGVNE